MTARSRTSRKATGVRCPWVYPHSYKGDLNPTEFFFHAIGGREGLVDTAVRTSQSGYLQRRMINALQDLKVAYDGTVRTTGGRIIQFQYGEDSTDPTKSAFGIRLMSKALLKPC